MEITIVTGLSGAGKSRVVDALEDIGYFCVDNMPPKLLPKFAELCLQSEDRLSRVAMVVDVRGGQMFDDLFEGLQELRRMEIDYKILFLECDDQVLARRYKETRRQHPLIGDGVGTVYQAIGMERQLLKPLLDRTDYLIDTTHLSSAQLKERVSDLFLGDHSKAMLVQCMSFGFKYGIPIEADLVFDVRFLPNPFYVEKLRPMSGMDAEVQEYVLRSDVAKNFLSKLTDMVDFLLPQYAAEGRYALTIGIGCTGGQHRSVAVAKVLTDYLAARDANVRLRNRDFPKT